MKFAVIGDIHSNLDALKSVYADIETQDVDFVVSTGDLVGYFLYPNEVVDFIRQNKVLSIAGNHDQHIANSTPVKAGEMTNDALKAGASAGYTNMVLTPSNRAYLKGLPQELTFQVGEFAVKLVHGSPRNISEYLYEDVDLLQTVSELIHENVIISGHTHIPYYRVVNNKHFLNAGSVGKPKHGNPNATYVVVQLEKGLVKVKIREVAYDYEKLARLVEQSEVVSSQLASMLRVGK